MMTRSLKKSDFDYEFYCKSPYNTYVFVSMRNSGKSKSIRNLVVELLEQIPHHNIILWDKLIEAKNLLNRAKKPVKWR